MQQLILIVIAVVGAVAILAAAALAAVLAAAALRRSRLRRIARPGGDLVAAAGTTLHVIRRGPLHGPTVVLIAGVGGVGAQWAGIQDRLAETVGSLAYDRAGLGWSGPARRPRTADALADELHDLLGATRVAGPYVLVGHSLGGVIARRLAARHPGDIAGLVLVDSAHEEQYTRIPAMERVFHRMTAMPGLAVRVMGALSALGVRTPLDTRLPIDDAEAVRTAMAVSSSHLPTAMAEMRAIAVGTEPAAELGSLPIVVLRHGRYERMPMLDRDLNDRFEALFAELQDELAGLSTRGRVVVAESAGHDIHLDRPELVVEAIGEVLAMKSSATGRGPRSSPAAADDAAATRAATATIAATRTIEPTGSAVKTPLASVVAALARPMLVSTGALVAIGSLLAVAGLPAGWLVYLAGYASAAVTFPALAAAHHGRLGRFGQTAFAAATATVVLATPVVAMVATDVLRLDALHLALMPYATSLPGMLGAFGVNLAVALAGLAVVRASVFPTAAGWLMAAAAIVELPVELGVFPLQIWPLAMIMLATSFLLSARSLERSLRTARALTA